MAAIQFPNNPNAGDLFTASNGIRYTYDGEKWKTLGTSTVGTEGQFLETPTELTIDKVIPGNTNTGAVGSMAIGDGVTLTVPATSSFRTLLGKSGTYGVPETGGTFTGPVSFDDTANFSGNVGVGTTSPSVLLELKSSEPYIQFTDTAAASGYSRIMGTHQGALVMSADTSNSVGSSHLRFDVDSTEQMRIDSSGRLLLGTTNAGSNGTADDLVVANNSSASDQAGITIRGGTSGRSQIFFSDGTSGDAEYRGMLRYDHSEESMQFRTAATERIRIDSSGRLLVGTTNAVSFGSRQVLAVTNGTTGGVISLYNSTTATANPRISSNPTGSEINNIGIHAASTNGSVIAYTNNDTERLRIDSSGRVGIGENTPTRKLHVAEDANNDVATFINSDSTNGYGVNIRAGGTASGRYALRVANDSNTVVLQANADGNVGIGTTAPVRALQIGTHGSGNGEMALASSTTGNCSILMGDGASGNDFYRGYIQYQNNSDSLVFATSATQRMMIDSAGRLLVGTTSTYDNEASNLVVAGSGHTGITVASTGENQRTNLYFSDGTSGAAAFVGGFTYNHNDNSLLTRTNGTERMRLDSSGNLLVGLTSAVGISGTPADLNSTEIGRGYINISRDDTAAADHIRFGKNGSVASSIGTSTTNSLVFKTGTTERMRIDSSGRVGIGTTIPDAKLGIGGDNADIKLGGSQYFRLKALSTGDFTINDNDLNERMRISSSGRVSMPNTGGFTQSTGHTFEAYGLAMHTTQNDTCLLLNRQASDGTLAQFRHAAATEGTISVSGSTVSYNGGHLSRWSQLPGGVERTEILRGSVLSNIDEMCEWSYEAKPAVLWGEGDGMPEGVSAGDIRIAAQEAGTENNEQLNRMKVSDVEGDKNVSGVFQAWDDDDDTYVNDFYCAMTGDFVIRIAQGTTVARGDLLMSAGDGTAKPQDDDIVRSKTIAKVTSTTVSTTYSDNSYCVPCVLMAC